MRIPNPWLKLAETQDSYVLEMDRQAINIYNESSRSACKVVENSVPEPFIGNPATARVILLLLNPGHAPNDPESHRNPAFKNAMFKNLRHERQKYPFYPLNPSFSETGSAKWWRPRLRELQREVGMNDETLSENLLAIEWFPYHSMRSALPTKQVCKSQDYTFQLATEMLGNKLVVRMRSKRHWARVSHEFGNLWSLKNPRCGHISKGNCNADLFTRIVEALKTR